MAEQTSQAEKASKRDILPPWPSWIWLSLGGGFILLGAMVVGVTWGLARFSRPAALPWGMLFLVTVGLWAVTAGVAVGLWRLHREIREAVANVPAVTPAQVMEEVAQVVQARLEQTLAALQRNLQALERREGPATFWVETLYHVFRLLSEAENEAQLWDNILAAFGMLNGYSQIFLFRGEHEIGPLVLMAGTGLPEETLTAWRGRPWRPPLWGVVAPVLAKRKPFTCNLAEVESPEFPWEVRGNYALALPLLGSHRIQGAVVLVHTEEPPQGDHTLMRLLEMTAWVAGRALESFYLSRDIQEHMTELVALQSLTRALMAASGIDEMLAILQRELTPITGPCDVGLILAEDLPTQRVRTPFPPDAAEYTRFLQDLDWRVVRWAFQAVQPVFYTPGQVGDDVGDVMFEINGRVMVVPLEGPEKPLGLLVIRSREEHHLLEEPHLLGVRSVVPAVVVSLYAQRVAVLPGKKQG